MGLWTLALAIYAALFSTVLGIIGIAQTRKYSVRPKLRVVWPDYVSVSNQNGEFDGQLTLKVDGASPIYDIEVWLPMGVHGPNAALEQLLPSEQHKVDFHFWEDDRIWIRYTHSALRRAKTVQGPRKFQDVSNAP